MIRQRWKSIIIWIIIHSVQPCRISALTQQQECVHRPSQFPPDYNDAGSYLFSPAVRPFLFFFFYYYRWQKLQLLLMTGNLKVPLLNSHRCHVVLNQLRKKTAEAMQEQRAHKSLFTDGTLVFYVAISRLEFLVTQMFNRSSAGVQPHEREAKNCSVCSWSAV